MLETRRSEKLGLRLIQPPTIFEDFRGKYIETWNEQLYRDAGIDIDWAQDDISVSRRDVLRGIHGDDKTWKLISCLHGAFYLVVVDWRLAATESGQWEAFELSDRNHLQVLVPPSYGNGHLVLSDVAIFHYKQSTCYDRASQFTIKWNDLGLGICWPISDPILSERDK